MYCTIALVNDFSVKKRNKDFILFGSSGDASETVYFEVFFDEEKVYKSFTFERVDKKDTISTCTYRPVFYEWLFRIPGRYYAGIKQKVAPVAFFRTIPRENWL